MLMMSPVASIILRIVPPWTMLATSASSGSMIQQIWMADGVSAAGHDLLAVVGRWLKESTGVGQAWHRENELGP